MSAAPRAALALALGLVASAAAAHGGFVIDYDAVFARHAAEVERPAPGVEYLELPGPVILERRGKRIRVADQSAWGPAGCALRRLVTAAAAVQSCPAQFTPEQRDRVAGQLLRGVDFFAETTVPRLSPEARRAAMHTALGAERARLALDCADRDTAPLAFAAHIAEDSSLRRFDRIFETPRLPVTDPCR